MSIKYLTEMKIKEVSHYKVEKPDGTVLKVGFEDLEDAYEFTVNKLLEHTVGNRLIIRAEIEVTSS